MPGVAFCRIGTESASDRSDCHSNVSPISLAVSFAFVVGVSSTFAVGRDVLIGECALPSGWRSLVINVRAVFFISSLSSAVDVRYTVVNSWISAWNSLSVSALILAMKAPAVFGVDISHFLRLVSFVRVQVPAPVRFQPPMILGRELVDDVGAFRFLGVVCFSHHP